MTSNIRLVSFKTGVGPTSRGLGARFADLVKNVKDFGAIGDGSNDDTSAIQAAIDYTSSPFSSGSRGIIFFPPGTYKVTSSLTFNDAAGPVSPSIVFRGCGDVSRISGTFNDFLLKRDGSGTNQLTSGIRVLDGIRFDNGHATGGCVKWNANIGSTITNCNFNANRCVDASFCQSTTIQACNFSSAGNTTGGYGVAVGENGTISNCDFTGLAKGVMFAGVGITIIGNRFEVNSTGISCGDTITGATSASGFSIIGGSFESNSTAIDFPGGCSNFLVGGFQIIGFVGIPPGGGNPQYGIRIRSDNCQKGTFTGIASNPVCDIASISVADTTNRGGIVFSGVTAATGGGGVGWQLPSAAHTAEWINCDVRPTFLFGGLPTGANLRKGDRYYITDGNQATIGGNVTAGSGSNNSEVVYDGTNWKRGV